MTTMFFVFCFPDNVIFSGVNSLLLSVQQISPCDNKLRNGTKEKHNVFIVRHFIICDAKTFHFLLHISGKNNSLTP